MTNTPPTPNRTIARSFDLEMWLRRAVSVSTDPIIVKRARGWFPRLVLFAIMAYVENKEREAKAGKS